MTRQTPRKIRPYATLLSAFLTSLALCSPALAGVVFEVETTYTSGTGPESSQMSVEGKNLKMEISSKESGNDRDQGEVVFRGDRRQMVVVDHEDKSYMVIDGESVQALGGQMQGQLQQAMKELEKRLEGLDPKQREMMEKMLKGQMGNLPGTGEQAPRRPKSEFRNTGERDTKSGYPCVRYDVLRGGEKVRELWVTDWNNVEGGDEVAGAFQDMASFYDDMLSSFGDMFGNSGFLAGASGPLDEFADMPGFPVVTRSFEGGELESETVLRSATRRTLDPADFEPPAGYKRRSMGPQ